MLTLITAALLFGAYRFINGVLDYAGDTRENFMREYAEADAAFVARELRPARNMGEGGSTEQGGRAGTGHGLALHNENAATR